MIELNNKHHMAQTRHKRAHSDTVGLDTELHLGQHVEERGRQHRVRLLQDVVERRGHPHQDGAGDHLRWCHI